MFVSNFYKSKKYYIHEYTEKLYEQIRILRVLLHAKTETYWWSKAISENF